MEDEEEVQESGDEIQGEFYVQVLGASNLKSEEAQSETYCVVFFSNQPTKIIKTPNSNDAKNPEWNHLDKFVLKLDKSEFFDIQLVVQIFNFENGKTLIGENLLDPLEIFENPSERKEIKMKLKNSDGEDGDFGEVLLLASWVKNEGNMPQFKE